MTGNETAKIIYKDDLPWSGEWTTWYPDGSKRVRQIRRRSEASPWSAWYDNGQKNT